MEIPRFTRRRFLRTADRDVGAGQRLGDRRVAAVRRGRGEGDHALTRRLRFLDSSASGLDVGQVAQRGTKHPHQVHVGGLFRADTVGEIDGAPGVLLRAGGIAAADEASPQLRAAAFPDLDRLKHVRKMAPRPVGVVSNW